MFVNTEHLPQILSTRDYTSQDQFDREVERLFLPAWHLVGTLTDIPDDGDFRTFNLYGQELITWKSEGEYHTFLNVCPHRFSRLTKSECGHMPGERLRCQYHGWEFDCAGNTRKIPDARSFRPMAQGGLSLQKYRTETVGQLIFMNFQDDAPSLREWLGETGWEVAGSFCGEELRHSASMAVEFDANWKIKIENSVESYHIDMVHTGTFGRTPEAEECAHVLDDRYTKYSTWQKPPSKLMQRLDLLAHKLARVEPDDEYKQFLFYPHIMFGKMRLFSWVEMVTPLSPTRSYNVAKFFSPKSATGSLKGRAFAWALGEWGRRFFTQVGQEDFAIIAEVQKGHNAGVQPSSGVVSVREERCWHFQNWVKCHTSPEPRIAEEVA